MMDLLLQYIDSCILALLERREYMRILKLLFLFILNGILWFCAHMYISKLFLRINDQHYIDGPLKLRSFNFEDKGTVYQKYFKVKSWKDKMPEGSQFFTNTYNKRELKNNSPETINEFLVEVNRAEITHWGILFTLPIVLLFNPRWTYKIHSIYALAANIPFIIIQRYNRPRFEAIQQRHNSKQFKEDKV